MVIIKHCWIFRNFFSTTVILWIARMYKRVGSEAYHPIGLFGAYLWIQEVLWKIILTTAHVFYATQHISGREVCRFILLCAHVFDKSCNTQENSFPMFNVHMTWRGYIHMYWQPQAMNKPRALEKSQISLSDKLQEMPRKFRVKFPGQKLL